MKIFNMNNIKSSANRQGLELISTKKNENMVFPEKVLRFLLKVSVRPRASNMNLLIIVLYDTMGISFSLKNKSPCTDRIN
jgi:hypothetical protein